MAIAVENDNDIQSTNNNLVTKALIWEQEHELEKALDALPDLPELPFDILTPKTKFYGFGIQLALQTAQSLLSASGFRLGSICAEFVATQGRASSKLGEKYGFKPLSPEQIDSANKYRLQIARNFQYYAELYDKYKAYSTREKVKSSTDIGLGAVANGIDNVFSHDSVNKAKAKAIAREAINTAEEKPIALFVEPHTLVEKFRQEGATHVTNLNRVVSYIKEVTAAAQNDEQFGAIVNTWAYKGIKPEELIPAIEGYIKKIDDKFQIKITPHHEFALDESEGVQWGEMR